MQWLFKIPAINNMEEPLCIFQWLLSQMMTLLKNSDIAGDLQDLLEKHKQRGSRFVITPNPVSLSLLSSVHCIYKGSLQHCFWPSEVYICCKAPVTCHCLLLSFLLYSLCPCIRNKLPVLETSSSACQLSLQKRHCCFSITFEPKRESKTNPYTWMFWLRYRIPAQIKCHCR